MSTTNTGAPAALNASAAVAACLEERYWYWFLVSSIGTMLAFAVVVFLVRLMTLPCRSREASAEELLLVEPSMYSNVQNWAGDMISGNTTSGRFLVIFSFLCSITAFVIYIVGKTGHKSSDKPFNQIFRQEFFINSTVFS